MSAISSSSSDRATGSSIKVSSLGQKAGVLLFGIVVLFAVGFLPMSEAHNAAHDTRHSFVFPCH
ncbi:CbtB-domain containing protein [Marinobacter nanhaiticus D15-8W]|uniref:CbtB-domain containing protein n=1 Tax=Marinobacter nanhaiticus D15-8W TaxID=626887 RepID=N6WRI7_9GAMM|nr:CbtB domain-containing protein [Marinobacter nanhaiticus]ENO14166.1 CbtB-domain containing protein [Marinobacter nanhaiticus D15-8W]BES71551.1 CbtB-domain containing protein [Marinobacter nanhaiticus D15-8W]